MPVSSVNISFTAGSIYSPQLYTVMVTPLLSAGEVSAAETDTVKPKIINNVAKTATIFFNDPSPFN